MSMTPKEALARVLRAEKAKAQLTDDMIAKAASGGLTERIVGRVMRGEQEPKIGQLALIAEGLGVDVRKIVDATIVELRSMESARARSTSINDQVERELTQRSSEQSVTKKSAKPRKTQRRDVG